MTWYFIIQRSKPKTKRLHKLFARACSFHYILFGPQVCAIVPQSLAGDVPTSVESHSLTESIGIPVEGAPCSRVPITFLHVLLQVAWRERPPRKAHRQPWASGWAGRRKPAQGRAPEGLLTHHAPRLRDRVSPVCAPAKVHARAEIEKDKEGRGSLKSIGGSIKFDLLTVLPAPCSMYT